MPWLVEDSGLYPGHAVLDERGLARIFVLKAAADYHSLTLPSVTREQKGGNSCHKHFSFSLIDDFLFSRAHWLAPSMHA